MQYVLIVVVQSLLCHFYFLLCKTVYLSFHKASYRTDEQNKFQQGKLQ